MSRLHKRARSCLLFYTWFNTPRHSPIRGAASIRMHDGSATGELRKLGEQSAQGFPPGTQATPFEKEVADARKRRDANKKRERALTLRRQSVTQFDIDRILARGGCLTQHAKEVELVRDPQLFLKWTPLYPHPLPTSYKLFDNERELRRLAVLPPETRIYAAAAAGRAWCVEELFAQGCPIHSKHGSGFTALHVAATNNDIDTVRVLLNLKVDVNATNRSGATPLSCAIGGRGGAEGECANLLRESGGVVRLVEDAIVPGSILDVPLRRPRRVIDDKAENLGRMVFTGQF